jgi:hypothetical protein
MILSKFVGGILDGLEFEVNGEHPVLRVPVKGGVWSLVPEDQVLDDEFEIQTYVKKGSIYEYQ